MELTWGDVLCAAMDACCAAGTDTTVEDHELPYMIRAILGVRGGAQATRSARRTGQQGGGE